MPSSESVREVASPFANSTPASSARIVPSSFRTFASCSATISSKTASCSSLRPLLKDSNLASAAAGATAVPSDAPDDDADAASANANRRLPPPKRRRSTDRAKDRPLASRPYDSTSSSSAMASVSSPPKARRSSPNASSPKAPVAVDGTAADAPPPPKAPASSKAPGASRSVTGGDVVVVVVQPRSSKSEKNGEGENRADAGEERESSSLKTVGLLRSFHVDDGGMLSSWAAAFIPPRAAKVCSSSCAPSARPTFASNSAVPRVEMSPSSACGPPLASTWDRPVPSNRAIFFAIACTLGDGTAISQGRLAPFCSLGSGGGGEGGGGSCFSFGPPSASSLVSLAVFSVSASGSGSSTSAVFDLACEEIGALSSFSSFDAPPQKDFFVAACFAVGVVRPLDCLRYSSNFFFLLSRSPICDGLIDTGLSVNDDVDSDLLAEEEAASSPSFVEVSGKGAKSPSHFPPEGLRDDSSAGSTAILSSSAASSFSSLSLLTKKLLRDDFSTGTAASISSGGVSADDDCRGPSPCSSSSTWPVDISPSASLMESRSWYRRGPSLNSAAAVFAAPGEAPGGSSSGASSSVTPSSLSSACSTSSASSSAFSTAHLKEPMPERARV
mmetsp:Transcript_6375/g.13948  ORF Transcript_6375/g.13948 Transcript_6375/m.13948 type:complete len:614 (-) Transcript_6375:600-2441(-)